jgi:CheY-like chemotaxis protein
VIDAIDRRQERSHRPEPGAWRGRILLVEHHAIRQRFVSGMLATLGFCVDVVVDGAEAVKAATRTNYRAILMDCHVPILDGSEATTEIRRLQGESLRTPIIGVSSVGTRSDVDRSLASDMDDHLTNPFNREALDAVMTRWTSDGAYTSRPVWVTPDQRISGLSA